MIVLGVIIMALAIGSMFSRIVLWGVLEWKRYKKNGEE